MRYEEGMHRDMRAGNMKAQCTGFGRLCDKMRRRSNCVSEAAIFNELALSG